VRNTRRTISRSLSGYLCGTHSGVLRSRRGDRLPLGSLVAAHRRLQPGPESVEVELGSELWRPEGRAKELASRLDSALDHNHVVELVLFGSQARGGTTEFSDVDATLVITDEAAGDERLLRSLRRHVLAAQRAVLYHQPMQHHGFEVTTPGLLRTAGESLALPRVALEKTRSLRGRSVRAWFREDDGLAGQGTLREVASGVLGTETWPGHPWRVHRIVSMFELLPTLYLQSQGRAVPKWQSFAQAQAEFRAEWWPYDVLREVRSAWPLVSGRVLRAASVAVRNPWLGVELWTRLPANTPEPVRDLLSTDCLHGLHGLARRMLEGVS
jgi:hypothetical protein